MWSSRLRAKVRLAPPVLLAWYNAGTVSCPESTQRNYPRTLATQMTMIWQLTPLPHTMCQGSTPTPSTRADTSTSYLRKRATLRQAEDPLDQTPRRRPTAIALQALRAQQASILKRWERDEEESWRALPARAWPAVQPNVEQMNEIRTRAVEQLGCSVPRPVGHHHPLTDEAKDTAQCADLLFQIATTLVFYNEDPALGLHIFERLAKQGHVDAMVACGVVLVEGLGVPPDEVQGVAWLQKAVELESPQAYYELGTAYYTGITDVLEENSYAAFGLFAKAAAVGHVASIYMMADCLATGEGCDQNVAKAVPLFYQAAEQGHRYARQRIRELLASSEYQNG